MFRFLRNAFRIPSARPSVRKPARSLTPSLELLDRRDLPSVTASLSMATGVLTITGDNSVNSVKVSDFPIMNGGVSQLQLTGVNSVTVNGSPFANIFPSAFVRSLQVDLKGGDDTFVLSRSSVLYDAAFQRYAANPWYNSIGSATILGGDGNDRLDVSAANAAGFYLHGGAGNDTILGSPGNDILIGGGGSDHLYGYGGNDTMYGAESVEYGYRDGTNVMYGGNGNDALYGGNGGNVMLGEAGNDSLYGGKDGTTGVNFMEGGAGADRFLVRDTRYNAIPVYSTDQVWDRSSDDAVIHLSTNFDWGTLAARSWSDTEVENVLDPALGKLVARTNNTRLLKLSSGGELTFERLDRIGAIGTSGLTAAGDNNSAGLIRIDDGTFTAGTAVARTVIIHEVGHDWDASNENATVGQFRALSGWTPYTWFVAIIPGYVRSGDGSWLYNSNLSSAKFLRSYSQYNPYEDFADSFEATIDGTAGGITAKANVINSWLNGMKS